MARSSAALTSHFSVGIRRLNVGSPQWACWWLSGELPFHRQVEMRETRTHSQRTLIASSKGGGYATRRGTQRLKVR